MATMYQLCTRKGDTIEYSKPMDEQKILDYVWHELNNPDHSIESYSNCEIEQHQDDPNTIEPTLDTVYTINGGKRYWIEEMTEDVILSRIKISPEILDQIKAGQNTGGLGVNLDKLLAEMPDGIGGINLNYYDCDGLMVACIKFNKPIGKSYLGLKIKLMPGSLSHRHLSKYYMYRKQ